MFKLTPQITNLILFSILLLVVVLSIMAYPSLPETVASHWNLAGTSDGFSSKQTFILGFSGLMLFVWVLAVVVRKLDPLGQNISQFEHYYHLFWISMLGFLAYLYTLIIFWNLGYQFDLVTALIPAFAALWFVVGTIIAHAKPNWSMGIRTPWTMSSDRVWAKTHALGGRLFKLSALVSLVGLFTSKEASFILVVLPIALSALAACVYSYLQYRQEK